MLLDVLQKFENCETVIYNCFGVPEEYRNRKIEKTLDVYWNICDRSLRWADTKEDFLKDVYYSFDGDNCDEAVFGEYEINGYVAVLIGCGEHHTPELWILKSENRCDFDEDIEDEE